MAMLEHNLFIRDDVMPSWWANAIQKVLSKGHWNVALEISSSTTVAVTGATGQGASILTIEGKWRWNEAPVSRSHPGGGAGQFAVWAVCKANSIVGTPLPGTDTTDYAWDLRITTGAAPTLVGGTIDHVRKIGQLEWDGAAITSVTSYLDTMRAENGGTGLINVLGPLFAPYGAQVVGDLTVGDDLTIGDDVTLAAGSVLTWATDTALFREAADVIGTTDTIRSTRASGQPAFAVRLTGDTNDRILLRGSGINFGDGAGAADALIERNNAHSMRTAGQWVVNSAGSAPSAQALRIQDGTSDRLIIEDSGEMSWSGGGAADAFLFRSDINTLCVQGVLQLDNGGVTTGGFIDAPEQITDPAAPAANHGRVYMRDNGSGKTQFCVRFATGAIQVLATQP